MSAVVGGNRRAAARQYVAAAGAAAANILANPSARKAVAAVVKTVLNKAAGSKKRKRGDKKDNVTYRESNGSGQKKKLSNKKGKGKKRSKGSLKKRISKLEKKVHDNYAHHTWKTDQKLQVSCLTNACGYNLLQFCSGASLNSFLGEIPYTDETNPSVENNFNMAVAAQPLNVKIKTYSSCTIRNNYLYPACLKLYVLKPKGDNSDNPIDDITNGIADLANPSATWDAHTVFPSDSKRFLQKWKVLRTQDVRLQSGDEVSISHAEDFVFDQKDYAEIGTTFQKRYTRILLIRICGVVAHESATPSNIGIAPAKVDCVGYFKAELDRPCDVPTQSFTQDLALNSLTTAVVGVASAETENSVS